MRWSFIETSYAFLLASRLCETWPSISRAWLFYLHRRNQPVWAISLPRFRQTSTEILAHRASLHPHKQEIGCRGFSRKILDLVSRRARLSHVNRPLNRKARMPQESLTAFFWNKPGDSLVKYFRYSKYQPAFQKEVPNNIWIPLLVFLYLTCLMHHSIPSTNTQPPGDPRGFALYCCPGAGIYTWWPSPGTGFFLHIHKIMFSTVKKYTFT